MRLSTPLLCGLFFLTVLGRLGSAPAAELVQLTPNNWEAYAPVGKEADCIYGDYVLKNDRLVAVVGKAVAGRPTTISFVQ